MSYSPYIPNIKAWVEHFKHPRKEQKRFYTLQTGKQLGEDMEPLKFVSATEQMVDQAKSSLERERENDQEYTYPTKKKVKKTYQKNC